MLNQGGENGNNILVTLAFRPLVALRAGCSCFPSYVRPYEYRLTLLPCSQPMQCHLLVSRSRSVVSEQRSLQADWLEHRGVLHHVLVCSVREISAPVKSGGVLVTAVAVEVDSRQFARAAGRKFEVYGGSLVTEATAVQSPLPLRVRQIGQSEVPRPQTMRHTSHSPRSQPKPPARRRSSLVEVSFNGGMDQQRRRQRQLLITC